MDVLASTRALGALQDLAEVRQLRRMALAVHLLDHPRQEDTDGDLQDLPPHLEGTWEAHHQVQVQR